jgi:hypothetical protein
MNFLSFVSLFLFAPVPEKGHRSVKFLIIPKKDASDMWYKCRKYFCCNLPINWSTGLTFQLHLSRLFQMKHPSLLSSKIL